VRLRGEARRLAPATLPQLHCPASLSDGPLSLSALAARHDVAPPTMSRLVGTLVERGCVCLGPWISATGARS
jgi:hypothetical protein